MTNVNFALPWVKPFKRYFILFTLSQACLSEFSAQADMIERSDEIEILQSRPKQGKCLAPRAPQLSAEVKFQRSFGSFVLKAPVGMFPHPTQNGRWFVIEQAGKILRLDESVSGVTETFLDIRNKVDYGGEKGLLGFALHPNFPKQPRFFVNYVAKNPQRTVISSFKTTPDGSKVVPGSEEIILTIPQPAGNHNGGSLAFGPDKFLYIALGDGGGANDQYRNGQNTNTLLGSILRINVNSKTAPLNYSIPSRNPFAPNGEYKGKGRPEIYAWGLRNPWKMSFDFASGKLFAADVGQQKFEEVNIIERGGNYGWPIREGMHCFENPNCKTLNLKEPILEYPHTEGLSITGGFVYRGKQIPSLVGKYIFGDFQRGKIWSAFLDEKTGIYTRTLLGQTALNISSFAQSNDGEVYAIGYDGNIVQLAPQSEQPPKSEIAPLLSETGCVDSKDPTKPGEMMIAYEPSSPLWSDGLIKKRHFVLPDDQSITVQPDGRWKYPNGTLFIKEFSRKVPSPTPGQPGQPEQPVVEKIKRIETRFMVIDAVGQWHGYTYEWNENDTDAKLLESGKRIEFGQNGSEGIWNIPDRQACFSCHSVAAGRALGLGSNQLNFESDEIGPGNQIERLFDLGIFKETTLTELQAEEAMPSPYGKESSTKIHRLAASWLHTNCSTCHMPGGTGRGNLDMRFESLEQNPVPLFCNKNGETGDLGISGAKIFSPGKPERSLLLQHIKRTDANRMPPLGTERVDLDAATVIEKWIRSVQSCSSL